MSNVDVFYDSDSGYFGGAEMHPEKWRVHGNEAQMVDASDQGPLRPATDDSKVNTCKKRKWPDAPGFVRDTAEDDEDCLSGAFDGAASND